MDVENSQIEEMLNFKTLVEINQKQITNYFFEGETNAIAETIKLTLNENAKK